MIASTRQFVRPTRTVSLVPFVTNLGSKWNVVERLKNYVLFFA